MKPSTLSTLKMFVLWLFIVPPSMIYIYTQYSARELNISFIAVLIIVGFLTMYFPVLRKGKPLLLIMWVTTPAFLMYGLFVEIVIMQIAIIAVLFTNKNKSSIFQRFLFNSLLFFFLSVVAAFTFWLTGGEVGSLNYWSILFAAFCYQFIHTAIHNIIMGKVMSYSKNKPLFYFTDRLIIYIKVIVMIPIITSLYFLYQYIGGEIIFLFAVPYFFITMLIRLNNNTKKVNAALQTASELGHSFSANLTEEKVIDEFIIKVTDMLSADYAFLYDYEKDQLNLIRSYDSKEFLPILKPENIRKGEGIAGHVLLNRTAVIYNSKEEWKEHVADFTRLGMESVICIPIIRNKRTTGVLCLGASRKKAFQKYQLQIIDILCSYFSAAIEKARHLQNIVIQMEYCGLTRLHNYRYLIKKLESTMNRVKNGELNELSVILLDIDYFKNVNDSYGHQSGNDVLCMLATILKENLPEDGVISRYGGEEFVYLLPGFTKNDALVFAEKIRLKVEQANFKITPDLGELRQEKSIGITISVGVSSAPEDTDEAKMLLRNADRALYIGAKQLGRNRVAEYMR